MNFIGRHNISYDNSEPVLLPKDAVILCFHCVVDRLFIDYEYDASAPIVLRKLVICVLGESVEPEGIYVGHAMMAEQSHHLYDYGEV